MHRYRIFSIMAKIAVVKHIAILLHATVDDFFVGTCLNNLQNVLSIKTYKEETYSLLLLIVITG